MKQKKQLNDLQRSENAPAVSAQSRQKENDALPSAFTAQTQPKGNVDSQTVPTIAQSDNNAPKPATFDAVQSRQRQNNTPHLTPVVTKKRKKRKIQGKPRLHPLPAGKHPIKRDFKDGVFRTLFNDADKLRHLFAAIKNIPYDPQLPITILTLDDPLYTSLRNDLAFAAGDRFIIFIEHQSTPAPNSPIRFVGYTGRIIEGFLDERVYRSTPLLIPSMEYYVFYIGHRNIPAESILRLSDHFLVSGIENGMELLVNLINISYNKHAEILQRDRTLYEYSRFVYLVQENLNQEDAGQPQKIALRSAVDRAVLQSRQEGILTDFLNKYATEVVSMLFPEMTLEKYGDIRHEEGFEIGFEQGCSEGESIGRRLSLIQQIRKKMMKGQTAAVIANALEESEETILPIMHAIELNPTISDKEILLLI